MRDDDRISELKKVISTLEWDIPFIKDNDLKRFKEEQLEQYKVLLKELREKQYVRVEAS